jgi:hypothetical protein
MRWDDDFFVSVCNHDGFFIELLEQIGPFLFLFFVIFSFFVVMRRKRSRRSSSVYVRVVMNVKIVSARRLMIFSPTRT